MSYPTILYVRQVPADDYPTNLPHYKGLPELEPHVDRYGETEVAFYQLVKVTKNKLRIESKE